MACTPWAYSVLDWKSVLWCVWKEIGRDNVSIVAAGVAFFTMLAVFPLITACLSIFGYVADPAQVQNQLATISDLLPDEAWNILNTQIMAVVNAPKSELGLKIILSLVLSFWSAGAGIRAIMRAMNIAYGETEKRGIITFYGLAGLMTLGVTVFLWAALAVIVGIPALLHVLKLDGFAASITTYLPWLMLITLFSLSVTILYRFGPSRRRAKLRWIFPGVLLSTLMWLLISAGFSVFVSSFGAYNETYGSLSAVIILLMWFWLTAFVVIMGAELNAELETHTHADTTIGEDFPIGERGAFVADVKRAKPNRKSVSRA